MHRCQTDRQRFELHKKQLYNTPQDTAKQDAIILSHTGVDKWQRRRPMLTVANEAVRGNMGVGLSVKMQFTERKGKYSLRFLASSVTRAYSYLVMI